MKIKDVELTELEEASLKAVIEITQRSISKKNDAYEVKPFLLHSSVAFYFANACNKILGKEDNNE